MVSVSTWIGSLKLMLICSGMVSILIFCKLYVGPFMLYVGNISQFILLWNSILNFLKPPYLFIVINLIIITIAASSRFNNMMINTCQDSNNSPNYTKNPAPVYVPKFEGSDGYEEIKHVVVENGTEGSSASGGSSSGVDDGYGGDREESDFAVLRSKRRAKRRVAWPVSSPEIISPAEKQLFPSRSTRERPINNGGFQGARDRALMRNKSLKRQYDTLEDTWKAITSGRRTMGSNNNTWQVGDDQMNLLGPPPSRPRKESETSKIQLTPSHVKPRKDTSWSPDELNQRVEMFIRKFNEEMRLQRQQSLEQFHEMINRGL